VAGESPSITVADGIARLAAFTWSLSWIAEDGYR